MSEEPTRTYRFGPLERRGLIAGWRGGQILVVAGGLVLAVLVLRSDAGVLGAVLALSAVTTAVAVACWPIGGRTTEQWFPTLLRWMARPRGPMLGQGPGQGPPSLRGVEVLPVPAGAIPVLGATTSVPSAGAGLSVATDRHERAIGVISDVRARTCTMVLAVRGHSFALLGPTEKERRIRGWSLVLAGLNRDAGSVHRLQWLSMSRPDDGGAVRGFLRDRAAMAVDHPAWQSYASLVTGAEAAVSRHDVFVAVSVRQSRAGLRGACQQLERAVLGVVRGLRDAEVVVDGALGPGDLLRLARAARHPSAAGSVVGDVTSPPLRKRSGWPIPKCTSLQWGSVRTDATWHATYWVEEWPRADVGPEFLAPLLLGPVRRTISMVLEPQSLTQAARRVENARTSEVADSELRRRGGFLSTARRARESEALARREAELADGHGSFRMAGFITVTAQSPGALADACAETEHAAGQARVELRRLWGDQERALTCTLPLCRGLV